MAMAPMQQQQDAEDMQDGGADDAQENESGGKQYSDAEVSDAVETLMKAEEIRADPDLMKLVNAKMDNKSQSINSIAQLRQMAAKKAAE